MASEPPILSCIDISEGFTKQLKPSADIILVDLTGDTYTSHINGDGFVLVGLGVIFARDEGSTAPFRGKSAQHFFDDR